MTFAFPDHFSGVAAGYAAHRPTYPAALFDALADLAPARDVAWDCGAGSGQASVELARRFARVIATDASAGQIANAEQCANVEYRVAPAEQSGLADNSISLLTVAQALHWFDVSGFYTEAKRVLRSTGVIAVWCYGLMRVPTNKDLESLVDDFSERRLHGWWPPERRHVDAAYADLPFPFERIPIESFAMEADWTLPQLTGYLGTWSSVSRSRAANGVDPVAQVSEELAHVWGGASTLRLQWPLTVIVGRTS